MSEFTFGYVLLVSDKDKLQASLKALDSKTIPYILHPLNEKYLGLFVDTVNLNLYHATIARQLLIDASKQFPIMYFDKGDHGWGYKLYSDGQLKSQISVNYQLDFDMICEQLEKELGQDGVYEFYASNDSDAYYKKVHASRAYKRAKKSMYLHLNLGAFKVFGLDDNKITQLRALLIPKFYLVHENGVWKQESEFKEIIGIPEMGWKNYSNLKRDQEKGN